MRKLLLTAAMLAVLGPAAHAAPQAALPEAQCWQEDTKYKAQFELAYWKGTLTFEFKR